LVDRNTFTIFTHTFKHSHDEPDSVPHPCRSRRHLHPHSKTHTSMRDLYELVLWPESQAYMDEPWFEDEAILAIDAFGESQAYFIPIEYTQK
jgi:hypothetical protein